LTQVKLLACLTKALDDLGLIEAVIPKWCPPIPVGLWPWVCARVVRCLCAMSNASASHKTRVLFVPGSFVRQLNRMPVVLAGFWIGILPLIRVVAMVAFLDPHPDKLLAKISLT